jgi:hypothetical protein
VELDRYTKLDVDRMLAECRLDFLEHAFGCATQRRGIAEERVQLPLGVREFPERALAAGFRVAASNPLLALQTGVVL